MRKNGVGGGINKDREKGTRFPPVKPDGNHPNPLSLCD